MFNRVHWLFQGTVVFVWGLMLLLPAEAQQPVVTGMQSVVIQRPPPPPPPPPPTRAQYENYLRVMKGELERAEARASGIKEQLIALDGDIESRMNRIISLLVTVRDSTDGTSTRIRKAKEDVIKGLKSSATYYAQQRDRRIKEMNNPLAQIEDDVLARDVAALNARIEVRITQSLEVVSSLTQHTEGAHERYRNDDTDYSNETREYRKAKRDADASVKIKADLVTTLRTGIDNLTREKGAREAELRNTRDPQKQEQLTKEIETLQQTIATRRNQLEEAVTASQPASRPVSAKAAFELDQMFDEMAADLRRDFSKFKGLVVELDSSRGRIKPLKDRIAKATAALEAMNDREAEKPAVSPAP